MKSRDQPLFTDSSITAYRYQNLAGIVSLSSQHGYKDSAAYYLGTKNPASAFLFARAFARDCKKLGLKFCTDIAKEDMPEGEKMLFIERLYVSPVTGVGPAGDETILARGRKFVHRQEGEGGWTLGANLVLAGSVALVLGLFARRTK
jgi:hypothetical protein